MVKRLKIYKDFCISKKFNNSILLIGNFDGLHIGHQKLFDIAKNYKLKKKIKIGVVTFDPIPKMFFNPNFKNYRISNFNQKIEILKSYNIDFIINKKFDKKFSRTKYTSFIRNILYKKIKPKYIFVSNNFRFGNKREGDVNSLRQFEKKYNYKVINPSPLKRNLKIVSSTLIRKYLSEGKIKIANKYLRRNWSIEGTIKSGRRLGRKIGFPTCNIDIGDYIISKPGVYAVKVKIGKNIRKLNGIANLGYRPTFNQKKILLEVNIFNFSKNIYNKKLKVEFISFIRGEKKFKNVTQLKKQIDKDILVSKKELR
ncbi:MAG: bifunctional riboflavin kinase/FAD synthetase [Candidatus Pelagibacter sp. TMED118]|nr:MAG: bifunctional riboflavin kinase/FAD synthetase [Candidatus Pelagibacter sp. TMED118]|tara:strand:- start:535 stop:1470 length:936 start_codon:yes stop_codon:yes gene_type:complete